MTDAPHEVTDDERAWLLAVGMRVRLGRVALRESQEELGARSGVSRVTVGSIERADHPAGAVATGGWRLRSACASVTCWATSHDHRPEAVYLRAPGKRIRIARLTRELTQADLADPSGISRNFISLIEQGVHGVDVVRLLRIAAALDLPLSDLVKIGADQP